MKETVKPKSVIRRNPLDKEGFLEGVRQKWTAILLFYSLVICTLQIIFKIMPEPYMQFALTIGSLFILGGSVDSFLKINASSKAPSPLTEEIVEEPTAKTKHRDEGSD